ncbi:hypothetical protein CASFOL_017799 [Castilleja foliolosa]|uniref:Uncharacterized protein n=1 Tax=Castilleja foliolosa TaxID=1961234 RepID=A0ABD3D7Y5_9LAMI
MFAGKRALVVGLGSSIIAHANSPRCYHPLFIKYVFSSITDNQGPTTPGKLSQKAKDGILEGSGGGYSGTTSTNPAGVGSSEGCGPTRDRATGDYKMKLKTKQEARGEDVANDVVEGAKAAAVGALETGLKLGEIAKEAVDGMWDVAMKTTEKVRDTVADDDENGNKQRHGGGHGEDLRRGPRGYS